MQQHLGIVLLASATVLSASCEKQTAKFRVHDKVRVKLTDTAGNVVLRMHSFQEDKYFIRVSGSERARYPLRERDVWWFDDEKKWHDEGPYYDTELESAQ